MHEDKSLESEFLDIFSAFHVFSHDNVMADRFTYQLTGRLLDTLFSNGRLHSCHMF